MRDHLPRLAAWCATGRPAALATVVRTFASAPLPAGSVMGVGPDGEIVGSVSGGCVEAAVYTECAEAAATGMPRRRSYGVSDDDALDAGLTCGGTLNVFIEPLSAATFPAVAELAAAVAADEPAVTAVVVRGSAALPTGTRVTMIGERIHHGVSGSVRSEALPGPATDARTGIEHWDTAAGTVEVFVQSFPPRPRLLVFGATDFAAALAGAGRLLGYRVTVCDARPAFAAAARFPDADEVVAGWPHDYLAAQAAAGRIDSRTAICVLTHDERFDIALLTAALRLPAAGYVGAMGSRRTHRRRMAALQAAGLSDRELCALHSPIGLDLQARTPAETAVSIVAEILAERSGGTGAPLSGTSGAIHSA